jgi:Cof subfamily protein (haloacid dehalogenase superfamily)
MALQRLLHSDSSESWRAAVIDLDGTLLDERGNISERSIKTLEIMHERNMLVVIATGRLDADARRLLKKLDFTPVFVSCNGALIKTRSLLPPFWEQTLLPAVSTEILGFVQGLSLHPMLFSSKGWHCLTGDRCYTDYIASSGLACQYHSEQEFRAIPVLKILLQGDETAINTAFGPLRERFSACSTLSKSSLSTIDIVARNQNKKTAVERFLSSLNISLAQTIAFGDAMNDLELLSAVGHGVLMGNAMHELQRHLPDLPRALPNHQDGVAAYLQELLSL